MKSLRLVVTAAVVAILAFSAVGCTDKNVAAKVNGKAISVDELNKQVEQLKKQYPQMFQGADGEGRLLDFKQRLLDNLVSQELVRQAAEEQGIKVSDADVKKQVDQLKSGFKDEKQFDQALKSAGMTVDSLNKQIREQLLTQRLIDSLSAGAAPTESEIKSYYDKNKEQFNQKAAKRASHILFKPEDKNAAEKALGELKDGADFASSAKKYSTDTATAAQGGDLGWPSTPYVAEFEEALAKLDKGEMSDLVKSPFGWHIIKVTDERDAKQQPLSEVKDQISQILQQQRKAESYQQFLENLRKKAKIEILVPELKQAAAPKSSTETTAK